jgi:uridine kinase
MIGDKLVIEPFHEAAANLILDYLHKISPNIPYSLSIAGESGSGKSETAFVLNELLKSEGKKVLVLCQDDYFRLPPHSNHRQRTKDISWVGPKEVKLDLLDKHAQILKHNGESVVKPLISFIEDKILTEELVGPYDVIIIEGTYTTLLENVDIHVFIDLDYHDTQKHRIGRERDQDLVDDKDSKLKFLEEVLEIEHQIISKHKEKADLVIPPYQKLIVEN